MLIYKRANFAPSGGPEQQSQELTTPEVKIQDLKREIKELSDNDAKNDGFESKIIVDNQLNGSLSNELLKPENKKTLNNLVKELSKILEKKNYDTNGADLLNLLTGVQEKAEFNRLNSFMSAERINLNDLSKFSDDEMKLVLSYIGKNKVSPECLNIIKIVKGQPYDIEKSITDNKARANFNKLKNAFTQEDTYSSIELDLSRKQLDEIFTDLSVEKFNTIIKDYTNITEWKGTNLEEPVKDGQTNLWKSQIGFKNNGKNFTEGEFVAYFNGTNESRKQTNEAIATDFRLGDIAQDTLKNFTVKDNKLLYNGQECKNDNIKAVFLETKIEPALKEGIFFGDEKAAIESKICDKITNEIKDKLQNSDQAVNRESWNMSTDNFNQIKSALGDKMFINVDTQGNVTYIPQKAKNYLGEFKDKEWADIKQTFRKPEGMAYVAALQILLNADYGANIKVDGKWTDRGETREAVRNFQNAYNNKGTDGVNLNTDGLPGKRTLEALLDGQYGDTKLDGQWEISQDGKTITFLEGSGIKIEQDNKGNFITIDNVRYDERKEGMNGNGYQIGDDGDGVSYLYTGPFKNGLCDGEKGTITRADGEKYVGKRENDHRIEGTFTWPNGVNKKHFHEYVGKFSLDNDGKHIKIDGTMTYENNDKYEGAFNKNNEKQGNGTYTWANGNILKGTWENGKLTKGTVKIPNTPDLEVVLDGDKLKVISDLPAFKDKLIYVETGEFVDAAQNETLQAKDPSVVDGLGKFGEGGFVFDEGKVNSLNGMNYVNIGGKNYYEYRNGMNGDGYMVVPKTNEHSAYVLYGKFENGVITSGTVHDAEGNKYEGEFKDGKRSGQGTATMLDGTVLSCNTFVEGLPTGKCTIEYGSSDKWRDELGKWEKYEGDFKNGMPSGAGKMTWENGDTYEGARENGALNGNGVLTFHDNGGSIDGTFENGVPKTGTLTFPGGEKFNGTFNNDGSLKEGHFQKNANAEAIKVTGDNIGLKNESGNYEYRQHHEPTSNSEEPRYQKLIGKPISSVRGNSSQHERRVLSPGEL